jgi:hypothetical protein
VIKRVVELCAYGEVDLFRQSEVLAYCDIRPAEVR